jgi:lysophospholipase
MTLPAAPLFADLAEGPPGGMAVWLTAEDGVRLRLGVWPGGDRGTVLLFPGRTEPVEKYGRAAADLARRGYGMAVIDWRGHGLSDRLLPLKMMGHVARFGDYQRDVRAMVAALDRMGAPGPRFLLAHSMGGAIGLRALMEGLDVRAAAMTGPMWGIPTRPALRPVVWALMAGVMTVGQRPRFAPGSNAANYLATAPFEGNVLTTDREMYGWMQAMLRARPELGLGGPTLNWAREAFLECRALRARPSPAVPMLTFLGSDETVVDAGAIRQRMARWPGGRLEVIAGGQHEVMMETPTIRARVFDQIAAHFDARREAAAPAATERSA